LAITKWGDGNPKLLLNNLQKYNLSLPSQLRGVSI
jgi:hypothetical protein